MTSIPISKFRAKCLRLIDEVARTGVSIEITKRGKTVAVVGPPSSEQVDWAPGALSEKGRIVGDIQCDLAEIGIRWEAIQ